MPLTKYLAYYQLFYGVVGVLYMATVVADNLDEGAQIFLITLVWFAFTLFVFLAGLRHLQQRRGWWYTSLAAQLLQVGSLEVAGLYLRLRCGASLNVTSGPSGLTTAYNWLDFESALSWLLPPADRTGLNLVALLTVGLLLAIRFYAPAKPAASSEA
jgi:hypothetical protein